jgi:hypothetical protein
MDGAQLAARLRSSYRAAPFVIQIGGMSRRINAIATTAAVIVKHVAGSAVAATPAAGRW